MTIDKRTNSFRQSVCRWCFSKASIEELAHQAAGMGLVGIDLVDVKDWGTLTKHGLLCTMTSSHSIEKGLNDPANHPQCIEKIRDAIEATAAAGFSNVICFSGNRTPRISDEEGAINCEKALKEIMGLAETNRITVHMELLNSKLNHKGYMCDRTEWGARLVSRVGSERFKLLYDIYHMQVQEGDVIATIRKYKDAIGHYHTAGVPGRAEIGDQQELSYPAIMGAIAETNFRGCVAHEFLPRHDPFSSLRDAVAICNV